MNRLVINVLGGLEIQLVGADSPLALSTRKSKALLAYPALSPGLTRSREHLATALWDRSAEEQAREWTENGELPFPDMSEEQREALSGTLDFPPTGSIEYKSLEQSEAEKDKS